MTIDKWTLISIEIKPLEVTEINGNREQLRTLPIKNFFKIKQNLNWSIYVVYYNKLQVNK